VAEQLTSPYIDVLERQRAELVSALEPHVDDVIVDRARRRSARLSVRLDASPLEESTADSVDRGELPRDVAAVATTNGAGWSRALKLEGMPTQDIAAVEYAGVRAAQSDEARLADDFFTAPIGTLVELQRRIAAGLLREDLLGELRRTSRAVNDGAQGMVIYHAPDPRSLPTLLDELDAWVRAARDRHPPLVVAGVVHLRLLHWRPFEAGNGRVARAASRVALRATAGDPWGLAVPEQVYAADPLSYVAEIAATIRRRSDLRPWIERTGEAIVASLEDLARQVQAVPSTLPVRGMHECERLEPHGAITVTEYGQALDIDRRSALAQLNRLCWTGLMKRDVGTHGLRYVRRR
jgi:hypothetical protein